MRLANVLSPMLREACNERLHLIGTLGTTLSARISRDRAQPCSQHAMQLSRCSDPAYSFCCRQAEQIYRSPDGTGLIGRYDAPFLGGLGAVRKMFHSNPQPALG